MIMTTLASIDIFILLLIRYFEKQDQKHPTQYIHIKFYHILRSSSSSSAIFYIQGWKQLFEGGSSSVSNRCPYNPIFYEMVQSVLYFVLYATLYSISSTITFYIKFCYILYLEVEAIVGRRKQHCK